jgi:hypothetical protein
MSDEDNKRISLRNTTKSIVVVELASGSDRFIMRTREKQKTRLLLHGDFSPADDEAN